LALSERTTLTPKEVWDFLAFSFLCQWEVINTLFGFSGEEVIEVNGAAEQLSTHEGQQFLENWLREKVNSLKK